MTAVTSSKLSLKKVLAVSLVLVVFLLALPAFGGNSVISFVILFCYYFALAQMWNLLAGYVGLVSFGQQLFIGLGGYTLAVLSEKIGISFWMTLPIAGIIGGLIAVPVGYISLKLKSNYFTIGTIAIAEIFRLLVGSSEYLGYAGGMFIKSVRQLTDIDIYYMALAIAILTLALVIMIIRSPLGLKLMALRDSERASASLGINVVKTKMYAFVISSVGMAMIGCFIYIRQQYIQPDEAFSLNWSILISFIVIIGGIGTIEGPIIGTLLYVLLQQYLSQLGAVSLIILGAISVLTMLYAPKGLFGIIADKYNVDLFFTRRIFEPKKTE